MAPRAVKWCGRRLPVGAFCAMTSRIEGEFQAWQRLVPVSMQGDSLWKSVGYRMSLFAPEFTAPDIRRIRLNNPALAIQLTRAVDSISTNFAEGYSRRARPDRIRFYEYSLGSARECREWWFKCRKNLDPDRFEAGLELFTRIVKVMTAIIAAERRKA
jgi:four helix bundle protein